METVGENPLLIWKVHLTLPHRDPLSPLLRPPEESGQGGDSPVWLTPRREQHVSTCPYWGPLSLHLNTDLGPDLQLEFELTN